MDYIELIIPDVNDENTLEILMAYLSEDAAFESFTTEDHVLRGYVPQSVFDAELIANTIKNINPSLVYSFNNIESQNWNAVWESNYEPVIISQKVSIRAPFHTKPQNVDYDIVIEPKMSFGTAHHPTTSQIINLMMEIDFKGKIVLDMGCGTSVLAIFASMLSAAKVEAVDNDDWAFQNSIENVERNKINNVSVFLNDARFLDSSKNRFYDIIIANINRNILVEDLHSYAASLKMGGLIFMSGFYEEDLPIIDNRAKEFGLSFLKSSVKNHWCAGVWKLI